jgi:hypothetical protein
MAPAGRAGRSRRGLVPLAPPLAGGLALGDVEDGHELDPRQLDENVDKMAGIDPVSFIACRS